MELDRRPSKTSVTMLLYCMGDRAATATFAQPMVCSDFFMVACLPLVLTRTPRELVSASESASARSTPTWTLSAQGKAAFLGDEGSFDGELLALFLIWLVLALLRLFGLLPLFALDRLLTGFEFGELFRLL